MVSRGTVERRKAAGVCIKCAGPLAAGHSLLCEAHRQKQNRANVISTQKKRARDRQTLKVLDYQDSKCAVCKNALAPDTTHLHKPASVNAGAVRIGLCPTCSLTLTRAIKQDTLWSLHDIGEEE